MPNPDRAAIWGDLVVASAAMWAFRPPEPHRQAAAPVIVAVEQVKNLTAEAREAGFDAICVYGQLVLGRAKLLDADERERWVPAIEAVADLIEREIRR